MSIRDLGKYAESAWNWGILNGCFGESRISPSDLDGVVERRGKILILEAKGPRAALPVGQRIMLEAFGKMPDITVVVIRGPKDNPLELKQFIRRTGKWTDWKPTSLEDLRRRCQEWYRWADGSGKTLAAGA